MHPMNPETLRRQEQLKTRLQQALIIASLDIIDESHLHKGHVGAQGGASHFAITVVSPQFINLSFIARHRLIYSAVKDMIPHDIHALKIKALSPEEYNQSKII